MTSTGILYERLIEIEILTCLKKCSSKFTESSTLPYRAVIILIRRFGQGLDHLADPKQPSHHAVVQPHQHPRSESQRPTMCDSDPVKSPSVASSAIEITMPANLEAVLGFESQNSMIQSVHQPNETRASDSASFVVLDHVEESQLINCAFGCSQRFVEVSFIIYLSLPLSSDLTLSSQVHTAPVKTVARMRDKLAE